MNQTLLRGKNVLATQLLLEQACKFKIKHFIFSSSGSVYGIKKEKKSNRKFRVNTTFSFLQQNKNDCRKK